MIKRAASLFSIAGAAILALTSVAKPEEPFKYAPPGILAVGTGRINDRTIYFPEMSFPLQVGPSFGAQHAYANSQVHPQFGNANSKKNYTYPWHDTYCEARQWAMPLCPGKTGHQGVDIQPESPDDAKWPAVAMEEGVVVGVTKFTTVTIRSNDNYYCRYLHMSYSSITQAGMQVGKIIHKGDILGKVSDIMGGKVDTSIHLHFDCYKIISGRIVRLPVYTSLISSYRKAWQLSSLNENNQLSVDPNAELGATGPATPPATDPVGDASLPKSVRTKNYGAITPQTDPQYWPAYIKQWPGLRSGVEVKDAFGKIIPAFATDDEGVGLWWYWMVVRAGFGAEGKISFVEIAQKYSGSVDPADLAVQHYADAYSGTKEKPGLSSIYFKRYVDRDELLNLADPDTRWMIGNTIFHHEAGVAVALSRPTFEQGIALATKILGGAVVGGPTAANTSSSDTAKACGATATEGAQPPHTVDLDVGRYVVHLGPVIDPKYLTDVLDVLDQRK